MKISIPSVAVGLLALVWLASPIATGFAAHTRHANGETGDTADISMFYDALKPYGTWYNTTQYGDVWHPAVSDQKPDWRPYTMGNWGQTDQGWTWISDEPFGWAVYHYGRWTQLKDTGWAWIPDSEWATAWVAWRSSSNLQMAEISGPEQLSYHDADTPAATPAPAAPTGAAPGEPAQPSDSSAPAPDASTPPAGGAAVSENYIGWAPLPPDAVLTPDGVIGPAVDVSCTIAPDAYCFVDATEIGDPDLSVVIFPRERDYFYVQHTLNVTDIAYYGPGNRSVYLGGPDFARVRAISKQPIPALQLDRQTGSRAVANSLRAGHGSLVRGNSLQIAGPHFKSRPANGILGGDRPSLPKAESAKAAAPASADAAEVAHAQDAMKQQATVANATASHDQSAKAVKAFQAEYKQARRSPRSASSGGPSREPASSGRHSAKGAAASEGESRHHGSTPSRSSSGVSHAGRTQQPESFMSRVGRSVAHGGQQVARGTAQHGGGSPAVETVKKKN